VRAARSEPHKILDGVGNTPGYSILHIGAPLAYPQPLPVVPAVQLPPIASPEPAQGQANVITIGQAPSQAHNVITIGQAPSQAHNVITIGQAPSQAQYGQGVSVIGQQPYEAVGNVGQQPYQYGAELQGQTAQPGVIVIKGGDDQAESEQNLQVINPTTRQEPYSQVLGQQPYEQGLYGHSYVSNPQQPSYGWNQAQQAQQQAQVQQQMQVAPPQAQQTEQARQIQPEVQQMAQLPALQAQPAMQQAAQFQAPF